MNKLILTIKNIDDTITTLSYELYDNPIVSRWMKMTKFSIDENYKIKSRFTNKDMDNIAYLISEINNIIKIINENYDKELPIFKSVESLDISILNYLHEEFEVYGDRRDELIQKSNWCKTLHESFLKLNECIHIIESALHNEKNDFPNYTSLYDFLPAGLHEPITEIDKLFLETKFKWGGLYCGYNTLGKDWCAISMDNDLDVLKRNQVRPQRRFAAETWLNFGSDMHATDIKHVFHKWYTTLNDDDKSLVPLYNLNEMTFGRLVLGQLIIDENFLKFHPIISDWEAPNHKCKIKWNKEIFSKANELIKIQLL
jgi:hypothetical protein